MIHQVDDHFVISSQGVWLPGAYADAKTARNAFKLPDETLAKLRDAALARGDGVITADDIKAARLAKRQGGRG